MCEKIKLIVKLLLLAGEDVSRSEKVFLSLFSGLNKDTIVLVLRPHLHRDFS